MSKSFITLDCLQLIAEGNHGVVYLPVLNMTEIVNVNKSFRPNELLSAAEHQDNLVILDKHKRVTINLTKEFIWEIHIM